MLLVCVFLLCGCQAVGNVSSISQEEDTVREGPFEFRYPKDWKINAEERQIQPSQRSTILKFRHPKNRDCYILIEIISIPSAGSSFTLQDAIAIQVRFFKQIFKHDGYGFNFRTTTTSLSGQPAAKLIMTGQNGNIKRTAVAQIASFKDHFYAITYQWYDPWGMAILNRLEQITGTFRFVK